MKTKHFLLIGFMLASPMLFAAEPTLKEQAQQKIDSLNNLITTAQGLGLEVQREKMTVRVAEIFLKYADIDSYNITSNTSYFQRVQRYAANARSMAEALPDFERTEVILMLTKAIADMKLLIAGDIVRPPTAMIDWTQLEIEGNQVIFNNKPIFLSDYVWKPKTEELMEYFGQLDSYSFGSGDVLNAEGDITTSIISGLQSKPTGTFGSIYIDHTGVPQWAKDAYPGLLAGSRTYIKYDIDSEGGRELQRLLLKATVPLMAGKN